MNSSYMLTVVGRDRPGIVARLSRALYEAGCNLGEASMARLAGNFTIMQVVQGDMDAPHLEQMLRPVAEALELKLHVDPVAANGLTELEPNVRIRVHGADRAGIVADVTGALADAGLHILDLNSEVGGSVDAPVYIMVLDGYVEGGSDALAAAMDRLRRNGLHAGLEDTATVLG